MENQKNSKLSGDYIAGFVDGEGCFDLQFRRDIRHERLGKPVYYSWKVQFVINIRRDDDKLLKKIQNALNCGQIHFTQSEVRYSVQNLENLKNIIIPFFNKYPLSGKKKMDFGLWIEAIYIIYRNKRKNMNIKKGIRGFISTNWNKKDFQRLIEIQKLMQQFKSKRPRGFKWISMAELIAQTLK
ncbi:MAG: LAGLIDADG family homing endonuclease [bacterium]|nr:LAGLIDADG family homing endonuclease [bacterium]